MNSYRIILASASPRRRELLRQIGLGFEVCPSNKEEKVSATKPAEVVCELSRQKAEDIFQRVSEGVSGGAVPLRADDAAVLGAAADGTAPQMDERLPLVIGADTVVSCDGQILGKPKSREDAARMLTLLQGRCHEVYTGVTVMWQEGSFTFYERTEVSFYPMEQEEIAAYIETGEPMDKAGAYGIQGRCAAHIAGIRGDYNNVVGLPVGRLYQELKKRKLVG